MLPTTKQLTALFFLTFISLTTTAGEWLVHITPENGPFQTDILITNTAENQGHVTFKHPTLDADQSLILAPGETKVMRPFEFDFYPMASLEITSRSEGIAVSARYTSPTLETPLTVAATTDTGTAFRFTMPYPEDEWRGLAVINLGPEVASVRVVQYSEGDYPIYEENLTDLLLPNAKYLHLLSTLPFEDDPDSHIEIQSSQPIAPLLLSGGGLEFGHPFLKEYLPTEKPEYYIRVSRGGGFVPDYDEVVIENGTICTFGFSSYNDACFNLSPSDFERLTYLVRSNGLFFLDGGIFGGCPDASGYSFNLFWDHLESSFFYDICSMNNAPEGAQSFIKSIFNIAEHLLREAASP